MTNLQEYKEEESSLIQKINELQSPIRDKILKILQTDLGIKSLRLYESIFRKTSNLEVQKRSIFFQWYFTVELSFLSVFYFEESFEGLPLDLQNYIISSLGNMTKHNLLDLEL